MWEMKIVQFFTCIALGVSTWLSEPNRVYIPPIGYSKIEYSSLMAKLYLP